MEDQEVKKESESKIFKKLPVEDTKQSVQVKLFT